MFLREPRDHRLFYGCSYVFHLCDNSRDRYIHQKTTVKTTVAGGYRRRQGTSQLPQLMQHQCRLDLVSAGADVLGRTDVPRAGGCGRFGVGGGPPSTRVEKRSQWSCCAVERGGPVCQNGGGFRAADVLDLAAQRSQHPSREF